MAPAYDVGRYWGRITNQQLGESRNGHPQLVITFLILGRVDPTDPDGDLVPCDQRERSVFRVIMESTLDYVVEDLALLGFYGSSFRQLDLQAANAVNLCGSELAFFCDHDEYQGKVREKWSIARDGGVQIKPLDDKAVRQLDAMFGAGLKTLPKPKAKPKPEPTAEVSPPIDEAIEEAKSNPQEETIPF